MDGLDGAARMSALMDSLRFNPPTEFGGEPIRLIGDYKLQTIKEGDTVSPTGLPKSNVLYYRLQNDDVIVARPSGTEPKIKFYYMLQARDEADAKQKMNRYRASFDALANS